MATSQPNILWIGTDEQHRQTVGAYGSKISRTPHIDALAASGLVFDHAFSPMAVCAPARAAMLTGKLPSEGSVIANNDMCFAVPFLDTSHQRLPETWATALLDCGYRAAHVGKWHVIPVPDDRPSKFGFEGPDWGGYGKTWKEQDFQTYRHELGLPPQVELEEELEANHPIPSPFSPVSARLAGPVEGSLPYFVAETAIDQLRTLAPAGGNGDPFFLRCEFWGPHIPCWVAEPYYSMYDPESLELPENFGVLGENKPEIHSNFWGGWGIGTCTEAQQRRLISSYLGYVSCIDAQIGRLLAALDELNLSDNTLVIYTSDHGDMLGAHGLYDKGPFMYDDIYRVPLIVRWPGVVEPGRCAALVYNMDAGATMWDIAGERRPTTGSARSLLPVLRGERQDVGREFIISEFWRQWDFYPQAMVHSGSDKFIFNFGGVDEYYDLNTDPGELRNRIAEPALQERIDELRDHLHRWLRDVDSPMKEGFERTLPAKRQRLAAAGLSDR